MLLHQDNLVFDGTGRCAVELRMEMLWGTDIQVLKAKGSIHTSINGLIGRVLTPVQLQAIFGDMIYEDWAGKPNMILGPAQLYRVECNKASAYLIFKLS